MEPRFVEASGIPMRWEEAGDGTPVVFVHGIPTSPRLWRHVVPKVRGARSMAWEMVGYGASIPEGRDRDISVVTQAHYLALWMREVGLGDGAVVVGHDLARQEPEPRPHLRRAHLPVDVSRRHIRVPRTRDPRRYRFGLDLLLMARYFARHLHERPRARPSVS